MKFVKIALIILILALAAAGAYILVNKTSATEALPALQEMTQDQAEDADPAQETELSRDPAQVQTAGIEAEQTSDVTGQAAEETEVQQVPEAIAEPELRIMAAGDIMLGRGVGMRLQKAGSYEKAFERVSSVFSLGDIVFANLETPFTAGTHGLNKKGKIVLKANPDSVSALTSAGIDIVSLSNNHMLDYYEKGLFDTMELLDQKGISHVGGGKNIEEAREPVIIERNGLKVGFLAYTDMAELIFAGEPYLSFAAGPEKSGVVPRKYETIREDIQKVRDQVDLLAVSLHWGIEESFKIPPEQVEFAHSLIDDGADIILGHHPHQFQGIEMYKGKPIFYSLGNFLFDQNDPENMESFIVDMKYRGTELVECTALPVRILDKSYVEIQTGENAENILKRQTELCQKLGTEPVTENDRLVFK